MVSTRKERQANKRLLSQLNDFDQDLVIGAAVRERQENIVANESTNDQDFTASTSSSSTAINESMVNVKTLERCINEKIDREMNNIVDTVKNRIQNAILTAIDNIVAPRIELAFRSKNASSGRDVTSVRTQNSERGEHVEIKASFENAIGNNNILHVSNVNDETRHNIPDEVSELSFPETHFDRQTRTHHTGTGQTAQTNQILKFLTGRILTPSKHHHLNLSTQVSLDKNLSMVEQPPRNRNFDSNNSINRLADAIAGIATQQQQPQAATMLKPVSTNTLLFDGKTKHLNSLKNYFTQSSNCNQR